MSAVDFHIWAPIRLNDCVGLRVVGRGDGGVGGGDRAVGRGDRAARRGDGGVEQYE